MAAVLKIHAMSAVCLYPLVAGRSLVRMWDTAGCGWAGHRTAATGKKVKTQPGRQAAAHTVELQTMVPEDDAKFYNHGEGPLIYDLCVGVPISHLLTMG